MSPRGGGGGGTHAKIPTQRGKDQYQISQNQPNDRNQYIIFNKTLFMVLFPQTKRQTSRLDQTAGSNPGLERQMPPVFSPMWVLALNV